MAPPSSNDAQIPDLDLTPLTERGLPLSMARLMVRAAAIKDALHHANLTTALAQADGLHDALAHLDTEHLDALVAFEQDYNALVDDYNALALDYQRTVGERDACREQLQRIGRKAFWASKRTP